MIPIRHGGGESGKTAITAASTVVQPLDVHRKYLEIQNGGDERCHISISDKLPAVFDSGLFIEPGAVYTIGTTNLTPARISAICDAGKTTNLYFQVGR